MALRFQFVATSRWLIAVLVGFCLGGVIVAFANAADGKWEKFQGCKLLSAPDDDADSFYVEYKGKEYHFRLYFADAPENNKRFSDRVREQAAYWGISVEDTLKIAAEASQFTAEKLKDGFTIHTKREDAKGQSRLQRFYAIVTFGDKDLAEELVREGFARIHGVRTQLPDGTSAADASLKLMQLEREAMQQRRGAWALTPKDVPWHKVLTHRISNEGKRHNEKCRYYRTSNNRPCKSDEGTACRVCGG
jgi:endonuclease YncB( thermonuclease family)